jgi:DNA-binding response OmpR family regulator
MLTAYDGDPAVAEVRIHHLRRKIDTPYGTNTIQTVRGAGYRIGT